MLFAQNYSEKANLKGYFEVQKLNSYKYERFRYVFLFLYRITTPFVFIKIRQERRKKSLIR